MSERNKEIIEIIPTINEPLLKEIERVEQRAFRYEFHLLSKKYLETLGLGHCIAVYARGSAWHALLHIDKPYADTDPHFRCGIQTNLFLAYLANQGKMGANFDRVLVIKGGQAWSRDVNEVCSILRLRGYNPKVVTYDGGPLAYVIFDKDGNMAWVNPKTIKNYEVRPFAWKWKGLKCENTQDIIEKQQDLIYPDLERIFHEFEEHNKYGVRIPVRGDIDPNFFDEFGRKGLTLSLKKCGYGRYVEITKYGYSLSDDSEAITEVNNFAARILKKLKGLEV